MALLTLKTEGHRETVVIDNQEFALAPFEGFSISEQHQIRKDGLRMVQITKKKELSDDDVKELQTIADSWFKQVAGDITDEVRDKLLPGSRQDIVQAYFLALGQVLQTQKKDLSKNGRKQGSQRSAGSTRGSKQKSG